MTQGPKPNGQPGPQPPSTLFERLERLANDALARNAADVSARIALAELLCGRGDYQRAFIGFHDALGQAPNNPRLIGSLARSCRDIGADESCLNLLSRLRHLDPFHVLVRANPNSLDRAEDLFHGHHIHQIDH